MDKVTIDDLQGVLIMITSKLYDRGLLDGDSQARIQIGDKTNGYPFRLFFTGGKLGSGDHNAPLYLSNNGFLGWTKREAMTTLRAIDDTLWATRGDK